MTTGFNALKIKIGSSKEEISICGDNGVEGMIGDFPVLIGPKCMCVKSKSGTKRFIVLATKKEVDENDVIKAASTPVHFKKARKSNSNNSAGYSYEEYILINCGVYSSAISALKSLRRTDKTFTPGEVITNNSTDNLLVAIELTQNASGGYGGLPNPRGGIKYVYKILPAGFSATLPQESPTITLTDNNRSSTYTLNWKGFISDGGYYDVSVSATPTMVEDTFGVFS